MAKKNNSGNKKKPKKFSFSLSVPGLCFSSAFLLLALIWAFILGVIVGRGYYPQSLILDGNEVSAENKQKENIKPSKVLKPEELGFYDSLSRNLQERDAGPSAAQEKALNVAQETRASNNQEKAEDKQALDKYVYIYQVAAFRDKTKANKLCSRINRAGFDTVLKKVHKDNKIWYRTFVTFKGTPEDRGILKEKLSNLGLDNFFLQEKRPLESSINP